MDFVPKVFKETNKAYRMAESFKMCVALSAHLQKLSVNTFFFSLQEQNFWLFCLWWKTKGNKNNRCYLVLSTVFSSCLEWKNEKKRALALF